MAVEDQDRIRFQSSLNDVQVTVGVDRYTGHWTDFPPGQGGF